MKSKISTKNSITKNQKKHLTIKQLLLKIWSDIQIVRYIATISTVLTLFLGGIDAYNFIHDKFTINLINRLKYSSLQLNNGENEFNRKWINDVEKLHNETNYKDAYNLLKGLGLTISGKYKDPLFNTELSPEYYLKRIPVESKYFDDAIILQVANIQQINPDSTRILELRHLITELDKISYKTPRYFFIKYTIAKAELSLDSLINYYKNLNERYFESINYNTDYINDVIEKGGKTQWELTQIQTLEYLCNLSVLNTIRFYKEKNFLPDNIENINLNVLEKKCIAYLRRINNLPDEQLDFLRGGFDAFMLSNPLFTLSMHVKYFNDEAQWFKNQRFYLDQFINGNKYIRLWAQ